MTITPTPITAALAGLFSALVMPFLWSKFGQSGSADSIGLVVAFLLVVALPAHAFVVGFGRNQTPNARVVVIALLRRVGAWLVVAVATVVISEVGRA